MIYIGNNTVTTAKSASYSGNVGLKEPGHPYGLAGAVRIRTPIPSSGVPMNSMPAASRHDLILMIVRMFADKVSAAFSIRLIVLELTPECELRSSIVQPRPARAMRICFDVTIDIPLSDTYSAKNGKVKKSTHDWRSALMRLDGAYAPATMRSYRADVEVLETSQSAHAPEKISCTAG
jgi:hypothetical protein